VTNGQLGSEMERQRVQDGVKGRVAPYPRLAEFRSDVTTTKVAVDVERRDGSYRHEALFYAGKDDFVRKTAAFIRDAVRADEPILVVLGAAKIDLLRDELGPEAERVRFADMAKVGANPARIIPAWADFVAEHADADRPFRGIGEPIWAERPPDELVECERHESLLNLAFPGAPPLWLVCPYDTESLPAAVLTEARRNHPFVHAGSERQVSPEYRTLEDVARPFDLPLPDPVDPPTQMTFRVEGLEDVRTFVSRQAQMAGMSSNRTSDLVLAVNELATNSVRHGGGSGLLRLWQDRTAMICEVRDRGRIDQPLAGRVRPHETQEGGFGLWLVSQLCDLVQIRSFATGSVVRLRMARA
jgi:anti-sigma regulatory factor (Ser/Thr protein kinase)